MLTPDQQIEFREIIEAEIKATEESLVSLRERAEPVAPDAAIGRLSRMDSIANRGTVLMAIKEAENRLARLRKRLAKVDDPGFSLCGMCGGEIPLDRLKAAPDRGVCVPCLNAARK